MKQQRFFDRRLVTQAVLAIILVTSINSMSYAGSRPVAKPKPLSTVVSRAYLSFDAKALNQLDPLIRLSPSNHDHTIETLARISVVGGFLLTANRLIQQMDSVKDAPLVLRDDGSCFRISTAGSKGLLVGFTMSRPLDF